MKRLIIFTILTTLLSCNSKNNEILLNENLVEPFYRNEHFYPENFEFKFIEVNKYLIDLNNNQKNDTIKLRVIKDWNDAGDFHQIEIILDNNEKIVETNFDGWVEFGKNYPVNNNLRKQNKLESNLILVSEFDFERKIILAFGWVYASDPGLLSIFEANGEKPKIIFNKNFEVERIDKDSFTGEYQEKEVTVRLIENKLEI